MLDTRMNIRKRSTKEQVYEIIKNRILTQEYEIGSKINIYTLSKELNVSNTPVREALSKLETNGLVSALPNTGFQVFHPSDSEVMALEETMSILLTGSYILCYNLHMIPELTERLEKCLAKQRVVLESGTQMEIALAAFAFDKTFFETLKNNELNQLYQIVLDKMLLLIYHDHMNGPGDIEEEFQEHIEILNAVKADNVKVVVELITYHFNRRIYMRRLENKKH